MKKSIRILLAGANPYNANKGVAALAFSTMRILKELEQELDVEIQICVYTSESTNVYDSIVFPNGLLKFQNIYPSDLFSIGDIFRVFTSKWKLYNLRELCKCNYIVNITGGDSFSDIYGANNFNSVNKINRLAHILRIPYLFLPQTYGPFFSPQIKRKAIKALSKADLLLSRDEINAKFLANELPNNKIASYIDVAFHLPFKFHNNHIEAGVNVGVNISQTLWDTPQECKIKLTCSYRDTLYAVINHLLSRGCVVHIIPHVVNSDNHEDNEYYLSYRIWQEFNNPKVKLAPLFLSPIDAKSYISALDLFIGARMHACIAAFSSGVPVLPMSYSRKFEGLFNSTLGYEHIINLTEIGQIEEIKLRIDDILDNRDSVREEINTINRTIVYKHIQGIKDSLKDVLNRYINK